MKWKLQLACQRSPTHCSLQTRTMFVFLSSLLLGAHTPSTEPRELTAVATGEWTGAGSAKPSKPNVLWVIADDMRAEFSGLGSQAQTPNINSLMKSGVYLANAYAQVWLCACPRPRVRLGRQPPCSSLLHVALPGIPLRPIAIIVPGLEEAKGFGSAE